MIFEIGKFYKSSDGVYIAIRGRAHTTMWGEVFLVETPEDDIGLRPVDVQENIHDFKEVTQKEWDALFEVEE